MDLVRDADKEPLILDAGHLRLIASPEARKTSGPG